MTGSGAGDRSPDWSWLIDRIEDREALVAVVGLGYVGLPVATTFAEAGFRVLGIDNDGERVRAIQDGKSYICDVEDGRIRKLRVGNRLRASTSYRGAAKADAVLICVPTPLTDGVPDLSMIKGAGKKLGKVITSGTLVVLESTTYPGSTEEILLPLLEEGGLVPGTDFLLAYSPERIDPGNPTYRFEDIPKIVGGMSADATRAAEALYGGVVPKVFTVPGTREAEMAKLIENTFRHVNIALVNELALYANDLGIDIWQCIEAAATKPFGFMPFWPSPGWGGHCIPLDPAYLSWRVRRDRAHEVKFVELAHQVNSEMPRHVVERIGLLLNEQGKSVRGSRILVIGIAYKGGTGDTRGSPGVKVLEALGQRGATVSFHDPLVKQLQLRSKNIRSSALTKEHLRSQDLVVVLVSQVNVDWELVAKESKLVFDCCRAIGRGSNRIFYL
ncbi:MAG: nucleotide sugar dehydrogenase [Actinomycetota bacterium]